ncbi:hypothetical protein [Streptomyces sp. NPDC087787]|uniref:hypothetical protein n=1 Tax=Streptomyces sp. NPDC087787 TaxID=3365803 RepID=UPI0037FC421A
MPELHTRLLADVIALGSPYPLVLTGGYAVRAHRLVNRPSQDLDVATENPAPMADIAATLRAGLEARGWKVHALETAPLSARFTVTDPATGEELVADPLAGPPCPVDVVNDAKMAALAEYHALTAQDGEPVGAVANAKSTPESPTCRRAGLHRTRHSRRPRSARKNSRSMRLRRIGRGSRHAFWETGRAHRPRLRNLQEPAGQSPFVAGSRIATHST